jgi:eukaryotic-like serine/threonine-protein kinase
MALTPGTQLGQYEISEVLGVGGMGEVYQARDSRLGRTVAIKVLIPALASDPDRLVRFEREAKTLASLNHQNVAQIYGLDEHEGVAFLVMELVEGPTLADRIARGPVPLDEALKIATQIAEALEAAHERGIIHRDLKPANVKVRPDGLVKVLDFGLAKVVEPVQSSGVTQSPTVTSPATMTHAGVILGTAAYMSPEQARGQAIDNRTDIWAFGCVLYELLSGHRAFNGRTVTDVLAAIIEREPDWKRLAESTPIAVRRLLLRCLTKDAGKRLRHFADARLELDDARGEPALLRPAAATESNRRRIMRAMLLVGTAFTAATVAWVLAQRFSQRANAGPAADARMERLTFDSGVTRMPAISPDGRLLAYASNRSGNGNLDIWVQQMSGGTPLRLTDDPADDLTPDFSPDGSQIVFRSERSGGGVYVVPALGGPARLIAPDGRRPRFSPDGSRIAYWTGQFRGDDVAGRASRLFVVALSGGAPSRLLPDFEVASEFIWTADSRALIASAQNERRARVAETFDWWLAPVDGGPAVKTGVFDSRLLLGAGGVAPGRWTADGVLFSFKGDLWRVPVSNAGRISGDPQRLTLGVGPYLDPTAGPDGEIVFARLVTERVVERASLTDVAEPVMRLHNDSEPSARRVSGTADGSRIVFERSAGGWKEIWLKELITGQQQMVVRVSTEPPVNATISPNGARIGYTQGSRTTGTDGGTGYVVETSAGVPRRVCDRCEIHGFLADNQRLLIALDDGHAIQVIDPGTGAVHDVVVSSGGGRLDRPHASPDDRWLAFRWQRGDVGRTFVARLTPDRPAVADKLQPIDEPTATGRPAGWSLDSQLLYLLLDTDGFRCIWGQRIDPRTGALVGKPFAVRHFHATVGMSTSFGNAATIGGFIYEAADLSANLWKLTIPRPR